MSIETISVGKPLEVSRDRPGFETLQVELTINSIATQDEVFEFDGNGPIVLTKEEPTREVYFHSESHGDEELVFFSVSLQKNQVHLLAGNSKIDKLWVENYGSVSEG